MNELPGSKVPVAVNGTSNEVPAHQTAEGRGPTSTCAVVARDKVMNDTANDVRSMPMVLELITEANQRPYPNSAISTKVRDPSMMLA